MRISIYCCVLLLQVTFCMLAMDNDDSPSACLHRLRLKEEERKGYACKNRFLFPKGDAALIEKCRGENSHTAYLCALAASERFSDEEKIQNSFIDMGKYKKKTLDSFTTRECIDFEQLPSMFEFGVYRHSVRRLRIAALILGNTSPFFDAVALMHSLSNADVSLTERLLAYGADANEITPHLRPAFSFCSTSEEAQLLLQHRVNMVDTVQYALTTANVSLLKSFLSHIKSDEVNKFGDRWIGSLVIQAFHKAGDVAAMGNISQMIDVLLEAECAYNEQKTMTFIEHYKNGLSEQSIECMKIMFHDAFERFELRRKQAAHEESQKLVSSFLAD